MFHDPNQGDTSHIVAMPLQPPLTRTVTQSDLSFHDIDSLEEHWPSTLSNVPSLGLPALFLMNRLR